MRQHIKMIIFVTVLGMVTSALLLGVSAWTGPFVEANREARLKSTIMQAYGIAYTRGTINDVFDETIEVREVDDLVFYVNKETGAVTYVFEGGGVWGPIKGIIALEADFTAILYIAILEQEETPGLGGRIVERQYLDTFVGVPFQDATPYIEINRSADPDNPSDVDAITGATRTSKYFEIILNNSYEVHKSAWLSLDN